MLDVNHLCPGCMGLWEDTERPCPRCGFSWETAPAGGRELPIFTILAGRYLLGRRIGIGGFGITYLAMDLAEERVTAIKEFFPASLASREGLEVAALPGEEGRYFREALRRFRKEADLLSRFADVPGIVRYRDYVTENGTAYLVMDYIEGTNLRRYMRETGKTFTQEEALGLMRPILLAVDAMHRKNVLHRDISPENLIRKPDGTLTLIDFGAAREFSLDEEENLTVILKHGYAPEEQYHSGSRQGPWTDLYACCAVFYQMVSGIQPQDAAARARKDDLLTLDEIEGVQVTEQFARIIEKGMTIHATERYASIRALMAELYGSEGQTEKCPAKTAEAAAIEKAFLMNAQAAEHQRETLPEKKYFLIAGVVLLLFFVIASLLLWPEQYSAENAETEGFGEYESEDGGSVYEFAGETDGLVWLMTGQTDASYDTPVQYLYEYNERGCYSRITSYGISAHNYVNMLGGSAGIDSSFGEIVSDFTYEYGENNRILSSVQKTDEGKEYQCQYVYWNETGGLPRQVLISENGTDSTFYLDESGRLKEVEASDGSYDGNIYFYYNGESVTIRERVYCPNPVEEESLAQFLKRYQGSDVEFYGVDYELSEDGELSSWELNDTGDGSVYAESYSEEEAGSAEMTVSPVKEYYRTLSPDASGEKDEYGNVLEHNGMTYSYAEYEIKDGIYTPTGRTSGVLPEIGTEMNAATEPSTQSVHREYEPEELIELLESHGIFADSMENPMNFYNGETVLSALQSGELDCAAVEAAADPDPGDMEINAEFTGSASGLYVIAPPDEWFIDDFTVNSLVTADMDLCWEITILLMDEGYYNEEDSMYSFLTFLRDTQDKKLLEKVSINYTGIIQDKLRMQYLEYWGQKTGNHWEMRNSQGDTVDNM